MASNFTNPPPAPKRKLDFLAGLLSYLVPGLGQIVQGRVSKGILFLVCVYTLFFYGIYIGSRPVTIQSRKYSEPSVVYLPSLGPNDPLRQQAPGVKDYFSWFKSWPSLYTRPQFAAQFWVGIAAWPAIAQYLRYDIGEHRDLEVARDAASQAVEDKDPSAAKKLEEVAEQERKLAHPIFGSFQREPSEASINAMQNAGDKRLELAWVFTVIAGVLNVLVIYDAIAGAAFVQATSEKKAI